MCLHVMRRVRQGRQRGVRAYGGRAAGQQCMRTTTACMYSARRRKYGDGGCSMRVRAVQHALHGGAYGGVSGAGGMRRRRRRRNQRRKCNAMSRQCGGGTMVVSSVCRVQRVSTVGVMTMCGLWVVGYAMSMQVCHVTVMSCRRCRATDVTVSTG